MQQEPAIASLETIKADQVGPDARDGARHRTLLVVASRGAVSSTLASAIEAEFPWIAVEQVESVEAACASFARPVALILIEAMLLKRAEAVAEELARFHPAAHAGLIETDEPGLPVSIRNVMASTCVSGILPMNLQLDVWLSIVRLMLRGGRYLPPDMLYANAEPEAAATTRAIPHDDRPQLTHREFEVLGLVSRGLQNKTIAAQLNLSEHTVKIHLHNIISKLRAHNRTEAAAWFRDHGQKLVSQAPMAARPFGLAAAPNAQPQRRP